MSNELFEIFLDMLEEACYDMEQEDKQWLNISTKTNYWMN